MMARRSGLTRRCGAGESQVMAHLLKENSFFSGGETLESLSGEQLGRLLSQVLLFGRASCMFSVFDSV